MRKACYALIPPPALIHPAAYNPAFPLFLAFTTKRITSSKAPDDFPSMADGNQLPSASAQKRVRRDDSLELNNPTIAKRPRNDDDPEKTEMIRAFNRFIGDEGMAVFSVETYKRLGYAYPPHQPILIDTYEKGRVIKVDPRSTQVLYGLLRGLVPGFTINTEFGIQILMTIEQFLFVRKVLTGMYFDRRRQMAAVIQRARAPPGPFPQALNLSDSNTPKNGSLQLDPQVQQVSGGPGMHPQRVDNDAPHVYNFDTAVQPHTLPIQFSNADVNPVPGPSQPVLPQAPQMIQRSFPQANGPPLRLYYKLFTPEDRALQAKLQAQVRREQVQAQQHRVPETASASGHNPQLPQQDNDPKQSSAVDPQTPYQPKRKNAVQRIVNGNLLSHPFSRKKPAVVAQPQRTQSESSVPRNQILGQQQHIQNISQLSQLASAQLDSSPNGVPTGATATDATDAIDVDQFLAIQGIQRSSSVAGYPTVHPTGLGLDIPPRSHSASISPKTPIAGPSATLPSTGNTPPSGTGLVNQAIRPWISHYPQASQQQTNVQNQAAARPAREFTFVAPHGEDYSPTKNRRSGSKSREQRLSVSPGNGRQSVLGSSTSSPASVPLPDREHDKREEEEEEGEEESTRAIDGADVGPAQLPPGVVRPTTWVLVEPQPVGGSFATSAPTQGGFAQYANQTASFMAPPQQQQQQHPEEQGQRPMSSATTPITPLPAPTIVPPIVAQTQQQPQVASDNSAAPFVPAASSPAAAPGPIIASDFEFDFNFLFGQDPPPGELATGGTAGSSNDASQLQAESTQIPESSEFEELFGIPDLDFSFDTAGLDLDINSQNWVEW